MFVKRLLVLGPILGFTIALGCWRNGSTSNSDPDARTDRESDTDTDRDVDMTAEVDANGTSGVDTPAEAGAERPSDPSPDTKTSVHFAPFDQSHPDEKATIVGFSPLPVSVSAGAGAEVSNVSYNNATQLFQFDLQPSGAYSALTTVGATILPKSNTP